MKITVFWIVAPEDSHLHTCSREDFKSNHPMYLSEAEDQDIQNNFANCFI
jgi:hypothetical protein